VAIIGSSNDLVLKSKRPIAALKGAARAATADLKALGLNQMLRNAVPGAIATACARMRNSAALASPRGRQDHALLIEAATGADAALARALKGARTSPPSLVNATAVSARASGTNVLIEYDNTIVEVRSGGSRSWRNNNPGNILTSPFARRHSEIGTAGGFAVFPDQATGMKALVALLSTSTYQALSLDGAIARYAPSSQNNTTLYQQFVHRETGLSRSKLLNTFTPQQVLSLANAIREFEGWKQGVVTYF